MDPGPHPTPEDRQTKQKQFARHLELLKRAKFQPLMLGWVHHIFAIVEPQLLRWGNWTLEAFRNHAFWSRGPQRIVPWLIGKVISTAFFHAQVLTLDELKVFLTTVGTVYQHLDMTIGVCPCRKGMNRFSDKIPAHTDIQFLAHGDIYLAHHDEYRRIAIEPLLKKLDAFDQLGLVHTVFGVCNQEGTEIAICNCDKDVCFPLRAEIQRVYRIIPGFSIMAVDQAKCVPNCPLKAQCIAICPLGARKINSKQNTVVINQNHCIGCAVCLRVCDQGANRLIPRKKRFLRAIPRFMVKQ